MAIDRRHVYNYNNLDSSSFFGQTKLPTANCRIVCRYKTTQSVDIDSDFLTMYSIQVTQSELGCECRIVERHEDTHVHYEPRLPEHHGLGPVRGDVAVELLPVTVPGVMCNVIL